MKNFLSLTMLAAASTASPVLLPRAEGLVYNYTNSFGLAFSQMNASLPNITVFATGGTIAGSGSSSSSTTGYSIGSVTVSALIDAVPEVLNISNIAGVQISNVGSEDITSDILLKLAKQINEVICGDPTMSGAVVTHGTDTMEESAFFLDSTVTCGKPVVIVGAMRPSTAISADGPSNLLQAVTVAVDPKSKDRGALVVLNDRIASAFYITKNNANTLETFKPVEQGFLGVLTSDEPFYYYPAVTPTGKISFDISSVTSIPRVDILYSYQNMQNDTLYNAVSSGAKGIVIAGAGAGGVSTSFNYALEDVINRFSIPIVQSYRTNAGEVPQSDVSSTTATHIGSGFYTPQKSRILLGLLLATGNSFDDISSAFAKSRAA
ncbi:hypothetical protein PV08_05355 [Exophiala spinifera]|uniref:asparaginase n=1 Tax=Exophiala spinifera TaxID=91928 RepID=A0A0D2B9I9_9EURO|nr:uncharacterized protein PV08_05355 [Exophiala spinifera]KIW15310.1 hypothetical protein PV08_05355 [Exophiala spinifera]